MGKLIDMLRGGKADKVPPSAFPPKKVEQGAKVESEHTSNKTLAREIARDHLTEDMNYYEKLKKMEKQASFDATLASFGMELEKLAREKEEPFYKRHKGKLMAGAAAAGALGVGAYLKKKGLITFEKPKTPIVPARPPRAARPAQPPKAPTPAAPPTPKPPKVPRTPDLKVRMADLDTALEKTFGGDLPKRTAAQERLWAARGPKVERRKVTVRKKDGTVKKASAMFDSIRSRLTLAADVEKIAKKNRNSAEAKQTKPVSPTLAGVGSGAALGLGTGGMGYSVMRSHATGSHKIQSKGRPKQLGLFRLMDAIESGRGGRHALNFKFGTKAEVEKWEKFHKGYMKSRPTRLNRLVKFEKSLIKKHPSIAAGALLTGAAGVGTGYVGGKWLGKEKMKQWKQKYAPAKKKSAASHESGPDKRVEKAELAVGAGSLGLGLAALAGMFHPGGPGEREMPRVATRLAKEMGLRNVPAIKTGPWWDPVFGFNAWFDQGGSFMGRHLNLPEHLRESVIAHEVGHAMNDQALRDIGPAAALPYHFIQDVSRLGTPAMSALMTVRAAREKDPSYKPGLATLAVAAPMLAEEAAASIRAGSHLVDKHGLQEGLVKSLPLVPAFATYATLATAPLLVAAYRKHKREAAAKE